MPDMSAFDAIVIVLDSDDFPSASCAALPAWLSSIPPEQASRAQIVVDHCDPISVCRRPTTEAELECLICNRLRALNSFKNVSEEQVTSKFKLKRHTGR